MNNTFVSLVVSMLFLAPTFVHAGPILRSGDSISVDATQVLKGDFYGFASTVTLSGQAENDVYMGGGTVIINAPVMQDVTIGGGVVQIYGDVGDDLRVVGGEVTLSKVVKGDVVVVGGALTILSTASVEGDVIFLGGDLNIEGTVLGGIHGNAETVRINSEVGGDVSVKTKAPLTLGNNANILGGVKYESVYDMVRAQNAVVVGEVHKKESSAQAGMNVFKQLLMYVVVILFAVLTLFLTLRKYIGHIVEISMRAPGVAGLVGIGTFLILPFVSVVLLVSVLGTLVGVILLALYIILCVASFLGAGILLGAYIQKILTKKSGVTLSTIVYGVLSLCLLGFVPFVGGFVVFGLILMTLGSISTALYQAIRG
jgi:hypothetical protein